MTVAEAAVRRSRPSWQQSDTLRVKLAGVFGLDAGEDVEFFDSLTPGRELELRTACVVSGTSTSWRPDRDALTGALVATRSLTVVSVWQND